MIASTSLLNGSNESFPGVYLNDIGDTMPSHIDTLQILDSTPLMDYNDIVQGLYISFFGRPADSTGLTNFEAAFATINAPKDIQVLEAAYNTDTDIQKLVDSFGSSAESKALYSGDTSDFVTAIYQNVLNRAPDAEGLAYWVDAIDRGVLTQSHASFSIMAGAMANGTAEGLIDQQLIAKKIMLGSDFTSAIDTPSEANSYNGDAAAATARAMLATVTPTADPSTFKSLVDATLDFLQANNTTTEPAPIGNVQAESHGIAVALIGIVDLAGVVAHLSH